MEALEDLLRSTNPLRESVAWQLLVTRWTSGKKKAGVERKQWKTLGTVCDISCGVHKKYVEDAWSAHTQINFLAYFQIAVFQKVTTEHHLELNPTSIVM